MSEEPTYTLDEARRVMREEECARGRHAATMQITGWGEPASSYFCDCGLYRYDATLVR